MRARDWKKAQGEELWDLGRHLAEEKFGRKGTFTVWCRERFGLSREYANRLIRASAFFSRRDLGVLGLAKASLALSLPGKTMQVVGDALAGMTLSEIEAKYRPGGVAVYSGSKKSRRLDADGEATYARVLRLALRLSAGDRARLAARLAEAQSRAA